MDLHQLFELKFKMEEDLELETKRENFPSDEAYNFYLHGASSAIIGFFVVAMNQILDEEGEKLEKDKSA